MNRALLLKEMEKQSTGKIITATGGAVRRTFRGVIEAVELSEKDNHPTFFVKGKRFAVEIPANSVKKGTSSGIVHTRKGKVRAAEVRVGPTPILLSIAKVGDVVHRKQTKKLFRMNHIALNLMHDGLIILH